jgi:hypothetical protein
MFRLILLFPLLLPNLRQSGLWAQSFPDAVTLRATEYNISPDGTPLQYFQAQVEVRPAKGSPYTLTQDCEGACVFENLPKGSTLVFSAKKEDVQKPWVGTFDMVLMSKHINRADTLQHPALLLAADADCNGAVNNMDIVTIRKLVLNIDTFLCRSWTFIDAAAILPANPFLAPLPTSITITNYNGRSRDLEFTAIKTGNINAEFPAPHAVSPPSGAFTAGPQPNPTRGAVWFGVQLPEPAELFLEIFDTGGRLLFTLQQTVQAGAQQLELPAEALPGQGLYLWRISAGGQVATGKIVRM